MASKATGQMHHIKPLRIMLQPKEKKTTQKIWAYFIIYIPESCPSNLAAMIETHKRKMDSLGSHVQQPKMHSNHLE